MNHTRRTTTIRPARRALAATLTVAALAGTACAGDDDATPATTRAAPATAAPSTATPTTQPALATRVLRVAHIDGNPGLDPATGWFADALAERSGGALTAEFRHDCCGSDADNEQTLLEQVRSGEADLGWVGVRAFAQAGTTAFEPLLTPLLIRSYAAEQTVIESDVANGVLAQLEPLGLVGLGLMPGGLRFPMSTGVPLTTPTGWVGQPVYTFESQVALAAVAALGAVPQHVGFDRARPGSRRRLDHRSRQHGQIPDRPARRVHAPGRRRAAVDPDVGARRCARRWSSPPRNSAGSPKPWPTPRAARPSSERVDREAAGRGVHGRRSRLRAGWTRRNRRIRGRAGARCGGGR